ncbi:hypothetical protein [Viridibacillus arvi]|uniref:Uncharacterized protein n=1 Tax=Viridibacillus arvi TaxID=263475 RepID=A0A0M0LK42_9BACL|nr:hypothetical protein [Viridibacillus arvi]KOO51414.1 hypothetical protein AMD00_02735 [Viridibacillus arvi]
MIPIILSIITIGVLCFSCFIVVRKRKQTGITGIKSALSSICLFLIAITSLLAYWLNFTGILSWAIIMILLILGAYFTKYSVIPVKI